MQGKYLITTDNWFIAPNGEQYQAVYGECKVFKDDILGIKTNAKSANWFVQVGTEVSHVIVAGCQIHYAVKCTQKPTDGNVNAWTTHEGKVKEYKTPNRIYFPED